MQSPNQHRTPEYQKIAEANRQYYAKTARVYETSENCIHDKILQAGLEKDLDQILALLGGTNKSIRALDACGGSGNVSLKLLKRNVQVTLADISPELQQIFLQKCQSANYTPQVVCSEIGNFLAQDGNTFDLIVFSSALHHLENIEAVLALAFERLAPGGMLYSIYDPTLQKQHHRLSRIAGRLEYYSFKAFFQTADFPKAIVRRIRRILSGSRPDQKLSSELNDATIGMLAEYHTGTGIDDLALVEQMRKVGYEVVWHNRYAEARFQLTRRIIRWVGDATSFKLLLRKPALT